MAYKGIRRAGYIANASSMTVPCMQFLKSALLFAAEHENASTLVPLLLFWGANINAQEIEVSLLAYFFT